MKHLIDTIKKKTFSFWLYFFKGLHQADRVAFGTKEEGLSSGTISEEKNEQQSVWADLLNHKMTQAVKDIRYETAHAVRKSMQYEHNGRGRGVKRNKLFDFNGNAENSEGYRIAIVQDNIEDPATVTEVICDGLTGKRYFFDFKRDFTCRYRLEEFLDRVVVKEIDKENNLYQIDLYSPIINEEDKNNVYKKELFDLLDNECGYNFNDRDNYSQYKKKHELFNAELKRLISGDIRSELIDFKEFSFKTFRNSYGSDDGITYVYNNFKYKGTVEYNGFYVLKFECRLKDKIDSIDAAYDEIAERKFQNKEKRETNNIDFHTAVAKVEKEMSDDEFYERYQEMLGDK